MLEFTEKCPSPENNPMEIIPSVPSEYKVSFNGVDRQYSNDNRINKLKMLRENVYWEKPSERHVFLGQLHELVKHWNNEFPDLREIFCPGEIEDVLVDSMMYRCHRPLDGMERIIKFVARCGYKDEPRVDEDGRPVTSSRTTPLHVAAKIQEYEPWHTMIGWLFQIYDRFDVNYTDDSGLTHFHVACKFGITYAVDNFLHLGQDPNCLWSCTGDTPLHLALRYGKKDVVKLLLRSGADPNLANKDGSTALHDIRVSPDSKEHLRLLLMMKRNRSLRGYAAMRKLNSLTSRHDWLEMMLRAPNNPRSTSQGNCPLKRDENDLMDVFFTIVDEQRQVLQIDARDRSDSTPLHKALARQNNRLAEQLLRRGADPNLADRCGSTPLHIILERNDVALAKLFFETCDGLDLQLRINTRDQLGNTPLHLVLNQYNVESIDLLLRRGADANSANNEGSTPLHKICERNEDDDLADRFFRICDDVGQTVRVNTRDNLGRTPLELAVASLSARVFDLLLRRGADLSGFVFPSELRINKIITYKSKCQSKFLLALNAMAIVESLEKRGYKLDYGDALKIMAVFAEHELFGITSNHKGDGDGERWYDDEKFASRAKLIMMRPNLSLHQLIQLPVRVAAKQLSLTDYLEFERSNELPRFQEYEPLCAKLLCEMMASEWVRGWALDFFLALTDYRLPIEISDMIVELIRIEDLCNMCLATGRR